MIDMSQYNDVTYAVNGAAMDVHSRLGCGFQEIIYQRALSIELNWRDIKHKREQELPIWYKDINIGTRRVDFLIEPNLIVEIKAVGQLEDVHMVQALNYLKIFNLDVALLINFGAVKLEYKRLINLNHSQESRSRKQIERIKQMPTDNKAKYLLTFVSSATSAIPHSQSAYIRFICYTDH